MTAHHDSLSQRAAGAVPGPTATVEQLERERVVRVRQESARRVFIAAAVLAGLAVVAWVLLAATSGGWVHGPALAASIGAPLAAIGLAGAAAVGARRR